MGTSVKEGIVRSIPKNVEETRTIPFIISDGTKDRHNTVLSAEGWDLAAFRKNGIVGYMHSVYGGNLIADPNPDMVIGKGRAFIEGDKLIGDTTFEPESINPFAEKIFRKVLFGSLNSCSVGFSELIAGTYGIGTEAKGMINETYYFGKRELLEYSIVNIPSNRNTQKRTIREEPEGVQRYASMMLGGKLSDSQIKNLTIQDALSLLEGRELEINSKDPAAVRRMIEGYKFMSKRVDTLETQNKYLKNSLEIGRAHV